MDDVINLQAQKNIQNKRDGLLALLPACAATVFQFGFRALLVMLISVLACLLCESLWCFFMKKELLPYVTEAVLTGLIVGMFMPAGVPFWIPVVGAVVAVIGIEQLFNDKLKIYVSPVVAALCVLRLCFSHWLKDVSVEKLQVIKFGTVFYGGKSAASGFTGFAPFLAVLLVLGAVYLLIKKDIDYRIPLSYIVTVIIMLLIFGGHGFDLKYVFTEICSGGMLLAALFIATDKNIAPKDTLFVIIYGVLVGVITAIFRVTGFLPEGIAFALLAGNIFNVVIERFVLKKSEDENV